jgi:uncharacterized protein (TIGR02270 family)
MARECFIPEIIDQYGETCISLWLIRDNSVDAPSFKLSELVRLDERIEANIDGLRAAEMSGWSASLEVLEEGWAGSFFVAGVLAMESGEPSRLERIIDLAYSNARAPVSEPYHPAHDPWRGLVSALAWVEPAHARATTERLLYTARPRRRWLAIAAMGARRMIRHPGLQAALAEREPLVRARAIRATGELGRSDLRSALSALLTDPDEECRFWAAWSASRLGAAEGVHALAEFAQSHGQWSDKALELLLRCLTIERAHVFLRQISRDSARRRAVIQAAGWIGDALYVPWLINMMNEPAVARIAGAAFTTITGVDIADQGELQQSPDQQLQPTDDPTDENVVLDPDEGLAWPDPEKLGSWWEANKGRFTIGTAYFLGIPKQLVDWIDVLYREAQCHRRSAALEIALRHPTQAMFEVRARGNLQQRLITRTNGTA